MRFLRLFVAFSSQKLVTNPGLIHAASLTEQACGINMVSENSGKIYRFAMDHGFGFAFAEVYDFTDYSPFEGRYTYVFNKIDLVAGRVYNISNIRSSGIALGPIAFYKFPNVRGIGAWKLIGQTKDFLLTERPPSKELRGMHHVNDNWDELGDWYRAPYDFNKLPEYGPYELVRNLETRILNGPGSVVMKLTMKTILDGGKKVSDYYDLTQLGTKNMYVQLINTYYSLERAKTFLKDIFK